MMKNESEKKLATTTEKRTVIRNLSLDGTKTLRAEKFITTFQVTRQLNRRTGKPIKVVSKQQVSVVVEHLSFDLVEVDTDTLAEYRRSKIPSFVLKVDGKFYYSEIPNNISFVSSTILGTHKCAIAGMECHRLSAASDENGGCAKVRAYSSCIEKYSFIQTGYETFNTNHDSFIVVCCSHYEVCPPRPKKSTLEIARVKLGLAQFVWDDVETLTEVERRRTRNKDFVFRY